MWDSHPVVTPLDPNVRLFKLDCPSVVDPKVHRTYRSIVGCISYLVVMTRPDLAFSFSQLSKFLQHPGDTHLAAAYRVLAYASAHVSPVAAYVSRVTKRGGVALSKSPSKCIGG